MTNQGKIDSLMPIPSAYTKFVLSIHTQFLRILKSFKYAHNVLSILTHSNEPVYVVKSHF